MNYENIATVIFSHPPIGTVGLSEKAAKAKFGEDSVRVFNAPFTNMFYSPADEPHKQKSLFKIVCQKIGEDNGLDYSHLKVVGAHGIGKGVDEMMQGISIAITMGATKQDFDNSVAIHPTASEEFVLFEPRFTNY
jgi:glutathione reductase (NADPH)